MATEVTEIEGTVTEVEAEGSEVTVGVLLCLDTKKRARSSPNPPAANRAATIAEAVPIFGIVERNAKIESVAITAAIIWSAKKFITHLFAS